jgi:hypothetical protein
MKDMGDRRGLDFFYDSNSQLILPLVHSDIQIERFGPLDRLKGLSHQIT